MSKSKIDSTRTTRSNGPAETHQKAARNASVLTTNQGLRISDDQNSL
jgi:hypothetical protein